MTAAVTLAEAESVLREREFDLVMTDLRMQGSEGRQGFDVIARVRAETAATVIVVFTAFGGPQARAEALRLRRVRGLGRGAPGPDRRGPTVTRPSSG